MHYLIYPTKDATVYQESTRIRQNTGLDELLEVQKYIDDENNTHTSRALLKFDLTDISSSLQNGTITTPTYYLNLKIVEALEVPIEYTVYAYPVSQSWNMGQGYYSDSPIDTTGVSWKYRDSQSVGTIWSVTGLNAGTTSSFDGGITYYTSSVSSETFNYRALDARIDVTGIVNGWMSGSFVNEGFLIKLDDTSEIDGQNYGLFQYFSKETNTIYSPTLETVWDDHAFATGSVDALTDLNIIINVTNMQAEYKLNSKTEFRVHGREEFPDKPFTNVNQYATICYLPETTYYSILDTENDNVIIPFDSGSQLSLDSGGNFFRLWMESFQPERFYKIIFKVVRDGLEDYYDPSQIFKIVR